MGAVSVNESVVSVEKGENILDGNAAFYAAHSEAGAIRETGYYARLPF